jgi:hypothetical protein
MEKTDKNKKMTKLETVLIVLIAIATLGSFLLVMDQNQQDHGVIDGVVYVPESGVVSRIKSIYDSLVSLSYGSESAGSWGDWGSMWNRIYSAGVWVPSLADAQDSDVVSGKQFYSGSDRTLRTGSLQTLDWEKQSLLQRDNRDLTDYGETSSWDKTNNSPEVWYDEVTGLYWSASQGSMANEFDRSTCDFYTTVPRGDYNGGDTSCGNAINHCATLSLATHTGDSAKTDWYLPSQIELMQAYINGIYKKTSTGWVTTNGFWSSTESQTTTTSAWYSSLIFDFTYSQTKTTSCAVRCVLRD